MTLGELSAIVVRSAWFSRVGEFCERDDAVPIAAVASSGAWDWLPTSHDQPDPIYGELLVESAERLGKAATRREAELSITKEVLRSLRSVPVPHPKLLDGPHDFTLAAKGSALYAARMAAREIVTDRPGFWCGVLGEYERGFWPCGVARDGLRLVLF